MSDVLFLAPTSCGFLPEVSSYIYYPPVSLSSVCLFCIPNICLYCSMLIVFVPCSFSAI